jgi:uncharacterized membrane protein
MNLAHIHLLLNHFPTIGFGIGLGLFLVGLIGKNDYLQRVSFVIFFLIALLAIPTYMSGNAAQEVLKDTPEVSQSLIRVHEDAALLAFVVMQITGFVAWLGLWQFRLISRLASWSTASVLLLSIVTFGLMARAANIGGEIRHPEILAAQETGGGTGTGSGTEATVHGGVVRSLGAFVTAHTWVWPSCETLHFVGLSILFTVVLIVDLRMLGMAKSLSFAVLYQLLPLGIIGFGLNFMTGMMFFIATPEQYTKNVAFYWKMLLVVLAGINVLYFMLLDEPWTVKAGDDAPLTAKLVALSAIVLWVGVLYFGNMLPFIGNAF